MKLGLIGDVHANADALRAVLDSARARGVSQLLVTGDLVGYYFAPAAVLDLLSSWSCHVVRGNHEDMLAAARADMQERVRIREHYGPGIDLALDQLTPAQIDMLCALPHPLELVIDGCRVVLAHGAPWQVDQYIYPDATVALLDRCATPEVDLVVLGHSHYTLDRMVGPTRIVNPGSVGQPRDGCPGAQWATFDTATRTLQFLNEPYDRQPLMAESRQRAPELPYLCDILERTR